MYSLLSASHMWEPSPRTIKGGSPPTDLNARTGESTPPGMNCSALCCSLREASKLRAIRENPPLIGNGIVYQRGQTRACERGHRDVVRFLEGMLLTLLHLFRL